MPVILCNPPPARLHPGISTRRRGRSSEPCYSSPLPVGPTYAGLTQSRHCSEWRASICSWSYGRWVTEKSSLIVSWWLSADSSGMIRWALRAKSRLIELPPLLLKSKTCLVWLHRMHECPGVHTLAANPLKCERGWITCQQFMVMRKPLMASLSKLWCSPQRSQLWLPNFRLLWRQKLLCLSFLCGDETALPVPLPHRSSSLSHSNDQSELVEEMRDGSAPFSTATV